MRARQNEFSCLISSDYHNDWWERSIKISLCSAGTNKLIFKNCTRGVGLSMLLDCQHVLCVHINIRTARVPYLSYCCNLGNVYFWHIYRPISRSSHTGLDVLRVTIERSAEFDVWVSAWSKVQSKYLFTDYFFSKQSGDKLVVIRISTLDWSHSTNALSLQTS